MYYEDYIAAKATKKALEKAFKGGRISEQIYKSKVEKLDRKIKDYEEEKQLQNSGFLGAKIKNGHFVVDLNCPCGYDRDCYL